MNVISARHPATIHKGSNPFAETKAKIREMTKLPSATKAIDISCVLMLLPSIHLVHGTKKLIKSSSTMFALPNETVEKLLLDKCRSLGTSGLSSVLVRGCGNCYQRTRPYLWILPMLWTRANNFHWISTLAFERTVKWSNRFCTRRLAKTGSTIASRRA